VRARWIILGQLLWLSLAGWAADQKPPEITPKLAALLAAKGNDGKPIITPAQRAYFDGLNDRLRGLLSQAVQKEFITRPQHLGMFLSLNLRPQKMELVLQDNCILCHTDSEVQSTDDLFSPAPASNGSPPYMNLVQFLEGTHFRRGLSCAGCHGGDPTADLGHNFVKEWPDSGRQTNRAWVVYFCARCHSDPVFMNQFNPALPTDQLAKFKDSPHGHVLLQQHDMRAPQCVSCHGVHGIRPAKDPQSKVYAKRVPETCGACHANPTIMAGFKLPDGSPLPTNQLAQYRLSVHGRALLDRGDLGAPACNDCHGNHAALPPGVSAVSRSCSLCHPANASLFDGSKHKEAFAAHHWPECGRCHGKHDIAQPTDSLVGTGPTSLCGPCHNQYSQGDPVCNATAAYFSQTITGLDQGWQRFTDVSGSLAAKGLDVDTINAQLADLSDDLKKSRTYIHSFSSNSFQQIAAPAELALHRTEALATAARKEYGRRQTGLAVSIALTGLLMVAIFWKLRRVERQS
jgi:hypothetical protein